MRGTELLQAAFGLLPPWMAARRGHDDVSLFVDLDGPRVLFVADGKDATTVEAFAADLADHDGAAENVTEVCIDMSAAFIKGTAAHLPNANITFDTFHAVKIINDAVDLGCRRSGMPSIWSAAPSRRTGRNCRRPATSG